MKPLLSVKLRIRHKISIREKCKILKAESGDSKILYTFFSSIVKNLNILRYNAFDSVTENIADQTLKAIFKYEDHPSILAIQSNY